MLTSLDILQLYVLEAMDFKNVYELHSFVRVYEELFEFLIGQPDVDVDPLIKPQLIYFLNGLPADPGLRALYHAYQQAYIGGEPWTIHAAFIALRDWMNPWRVFGNIFKNAGATPRNKCLTVMADNWGHLDLLTYLASSIIGDLAVSRAETAIEAFGVLMEAKLGTSRVFCNYAPWNA